MANCRDIQSQLTAYVDGETDSVSRALVEAHLQRCPPCRSLLTTERTTHELLASRRGDLRGCAPDGLRRRCAAQRAIAAGRTSWLAGRMLVPLSVAATLLLGVALFLGFGWGSSVETYAAQLADDHVKCFRFLPPSGVVDAAALAAAWQQRGGWALKTAADSETEDLRLIDLRRCGSSSGPVAHLLYRWRGEPLSVYVLNSTVEDIPDATQAAHAHETMTTQGEHAVMWRRNRRTYTVVARGQVADVERVAEHIRNTIE